MRGHDDGGFSVGGRTARECPSARLAALLPQLHVQKHARVIGCLCARQAGKIFRRACECVVRKGGAAGAHHCRGNAIGHFKGFAHRQAVAKAAEHSADVRVACADGVRNLRSGHGGQILQSAVIQPADAACAKRDDDRLLRLRKERAHRCLQRGFSAEGEGFSFI